MKREGLFKVATDAPQTFWFIVENPEMSKNTLTFKKLGTIVKGRKMYDPKSVRDIVFFDFPIKLEELQKLSEEEEKEFKELMEATVC